MRNDRLVGEHIGMYQTPCLFIAELFRKMRASLIQYNSYELWIINVYAAMPTEVEIGYSSSSVVYLLEQSDGITSKVSGRKAQSAFC